MTEQNPNPDTEPQPAPKAPETADAAAVYAAYDKTFQRFVGGTHPSKAKAKAAAKAKGVEGDRVEVREV